MSLRKRPRDSPRSFLPPRRHQPLQSRKTRPTVDAVFEFLLANCNARVVALSCAGLIFLILACIWTSSGVKQVDDVPESTPIRVQSTRAAALLAAGHHAYTAENPQSHFLQLLRRRLGRNNEDDTIRISSESVLEQWSRTTEAGDVLVVANQLAFIDRSGGIGTAHRNLVVMLAASGVRVRVLYVRQYSKAIPSSANSDADLDSVSDMLAKDGIRMEVLPALGVGAGDSPDSTAEMAASLSVLWWMQRQAARGSLEASILCQDYLGACALPIAARRARVSFRESRFTVVAHGPLLWAKAMSSHHLLPQDLATAGAEQYSLEDADLRVWSSRWLPRYLRRKLSYGIEIERLDGPASEAPAERGSETGGNEDLRALLRGLGAALAAAGSQSQWPVKRRPFLSLPNAMLPPPEKSQVAFHAYGAGDEASAPHTEPGITPEEAEALEGAEAKRSAQISPASVPPGPNRKTIRSIAFFGRIETRKGIVALCDALDMVAASAEVGRLPMLANRTAAQVQPTDPILAAARRKAGKGLTIQVFGSETPIEGVQGGKFVAQRARRWSRAGWRLEMRHDLDSEQALDAMRESGALVVLPGRGDNSPATVIECVLAGLPVLTVEDSGAMELIDSRDRSSCVLPDLGRQLIRHERPVTGFSAGDIRQLASGIATRVLEGAIACRPALPPLAAVGAWHELLVPRQWPRTHHGGKDTAQKENYGSVQTAAVVLRSNGKNMAKFAASLRSVVASCAEASQFLQPCTVIPVLVQAQVARQDASGLQAQLKAMDAVSAEARSMLEGAASQVDVAAAAAHSPAATLHTEVIGPQRPVRVVYVLDDDIVVHRYGLLALARAQAAAVVDGRASQYVLPFGTRREVSASWVQLDEPAMLAYDAKSPCLETPPQRCPVVDADGYTRHRTKYSRKSCTSGRSGGWFFGGADNGKSSLEKMLPGLGRRRPGGALAPTRHVCGADQVRSSAKLSAEDGVSAVPGRISARPVFPSRSAAAVAAGAFLGDPGGLWGVRSGKLRGLPEYKVPAARLSIGMQSHRFCGGEASAEAKQDPGCQHSPKATKRALVAALEDSHGGGTLVPAAVYAWLPSGFSTEELVSLLGWTSAEAALIGKAAGTLQNNGRSPNNPAERIIARGSSNYGGWNAGVDCQRGAELLRPGKQLELLGVCALDLPMPQ